MISAKEQVIAASMLLQSGNFTWHAFNMISLLEQGKDGMKFGPRLRGMSASLYAAYETRPAPHFLISIHGTADPRYQRLTFSRNIYTSQTLEYI